MSNKSVLEHAAGVFKQDYPGLTAEAIVCFLVAIDIKDPTVGDVARAVGMTEPHAYQHISMLTSGGAGLVSMINAGGGRNLLVLTPQGQKLKETVAAAFRD